MLTHHRTLQECEVHLARDVTNVRLLGELPLDAEDYRHLKNLIHTARQQSSLNALCHAAPLSLACLLVWTGSYKYQDHTFWPLLEDVLGPLDANAQRRLGQMFANCLNTHKLLSVDIPDGYTNITPILLHGGIPNRCLPEYFEKVLLTWVQRRGLVAEADVRHELAILREDEAKLVHISTRSIATETDVKQEIARLRQRQRMLRKVIELAPDLEHLIELEDFVATHAREASVSSDVIDTIETARQGWSVEVDRLEHEVAAAETRLATTRASVAVTLSPPEQALLEHAEAISHAAGWGEEIARQQRMLQVYEADVVTLRAQMQAEWKTLSSEPWQAVHGKHLQALSVVGLELDLTHTGDLHRRHAQALARKAEFEETYVRLQTQWWTICGAFGLLILIWLAVGGVLYGFDFITVGGSAGVVAVWAGLAWMGRGRFRMAARKHNDSVEQAAQAEHALRTHEHAIAQRLAPLGIQLTEPIREEICTRLAALKHLHAQLSELDEICQALVADREERTTGIKSLAQSVHLLAPAHVATVNGSGSTGQHSAAQGHEMLLARMAEALQAAQARAARVQEVPPVDPDLENHLQSLRVELEESLKNRQVLDDVLGKFGKGKPEAGLQMLKRVHASQIEAQALRARLSEAYPKTLGRYETYIQALRAQGQTPAQLYAETAAELDRLQEVSRQQAAKTPVVMPPHPTPFAGIDEPIRRYLLYGEDSSADFMVHTTALLQAARQDHTPPPEAIAALPPRERAAFERWWADYRVAEIELEEENDAIENGGRFATPQVYLDPERGEVRCQIPAQRFVVPIGMSQTGRVEAETGGATLTLTAHLSEASRDAGPTDTLPLRLYVTPDGLWETRPVETLLAHPAGGYRVQLQIGDLLIREWDITLRHANAPYWAFHATCRPLKGEYLPRAVVWLVVPHGTTLAPGDCHIVEPSEMMDGWSGHLLYNLDLTKVSQLTLHGERGPVEVLTVETASQELALVGAEPLSTAYASASHGHTGAPIYVEMPPVLRLPSVAATELDRWRYSVTGITLNGEPVGVRGRLSELVAGIDAAQADKPISIELTAARLLGERPRGYFSLRLRKPPYVDWQEDICLLPEFEAKFTQPLYLPYAPEHAARQITLELQLPWHTLFVPDAPAHTHAPDAQKDKRRPQITAPFTAEGISGRLLPATLPARLDGEEDAPVGIGITLPIPKLQWRLEIDNALDRETWLDLQGEALWLGDWEDASEVYLWVRVPTWIGGELILGLSKSSKYCQVQRMEKGMARFDLLALRDELRRGPCLNGLTLTHSDERWQIRQTPICSIHTRWEAHAFTCAQTVEGDAIVLEVAWREYGKAEAKQLYLWGPGSADVPISTQEVPGASTEVRMELPVEALPPGRYRLHLVEEDPWEAVAVARPRADDRNTQDIDIVATRAVYKDRVLTLKYIAEKKIHLRHSPKATYAITIQSRMSERALQPEAAEHMDNEEASSRGWYKGMLAVSDPDWMAEIEAVNPVKFEFGAADDELIYIEDRYGDGAMYCRDCKRLIWDREIIRHEADRKHKLIGPLEFFKLETE